MTTMKSDIFSQLCDEGVLPRLVDVLEEYQVREQFDAHDMDVCHI